MSPTAQDPQDPPDARDPHDLDACDAAALAALDAEHARFEDALEALRELPPHLLAHGPDERARAVASRVVDAFGAEATTHRATEERLVLPVLRRLGGRAGTVLAARLEAEHDLIARAWSHCRPALEDLAAGRRWSVETAAFEFERWRDFAALATAHMLAEHGAAFPTVRALLQGAPPPA